MDPRLDLNAPVVERDLGAEREIADPLPEGTVPDLDALGTCTDSPMCIARTHHRDDVCRGDDYCWISVDDNDHIPHHVSHGGRCWKEIDDAGEIQMIFDVERDAPETVVTSVGDVEPAHDEASPGVHSPAPGDAPVVPDPIGAGDVLYSEGPSGFETLRDELYARLTAEGNPPQLSITLATLYAEWKLANVPETMSMLADLASSIGNVLGGGDGGGGFLQKMIGKAMKGQAG